MKYITDEAEINAQFSTIIHALLEKHDAAKTSAMDAYAAFFRAKGNTPEKDEAWSAYQIARDARRAAEVELNAALDARAAAKKKLKAANRKAWFNAAKEAKRING